MRRLGAALLRNELSGVTIAWEQECRGHDQGDIDKRAEYAGDKKRVLDWRCGLCAWNISLGQFEFSFSVSRIRLMACRGAE